LLLSPLHAGALYAYVPAVLISSLGYSALALWWAIDQFQREEVLFREAERFELRLWIRHLLRDKEPIPSFGEAGFCFVLIMLLQFLFMRFLKQRLDIFADAGAFARTQVMFQLLLVQQMAIIATPALMMGVMLTTSVRQTFSLRWPGWSFLAAAAVLPFALHPLDIELLRRMKWLFGDLPQGIEQALAPMSDPNQPLWLVLTAFAVAPAVCEEVAFRGFMLRGFSRGGRLGLAVVLSSVAFGAMHMIPEQVFNTMLIGLVLGALTIHSRSLLPAVLFHFFNNALGVAHARIGSKLPELLPNSPFVSFDDDSIRYHWPTLIVCLAIAGPLLVWIFRPLCSRKGPAVPQTGAVDRVPVIRGAGSPAVKGL
jgi:sodium transport system permease protein